MEAFGQARARELLDIIAAYLRKECPNESGGLSEPQLKEFVRKSMERAATHALSVEWDLCRFCLLAILYGQMFDTEQDWAREILGQRDSYSPEERIDLLEHYHLNHLVPGHRASHGD